jgi:hypothetical protein
LTNPLIFNIERTEGRPTEVYSPISERTAISQGASHGHEVDPDGK